jgi:hypothetical protein
MYSGMQLTTEIPLPRSASLRSSPNQREYISCEVVQSLSYSVHWTLVRVRIAWKQQIFAVSSLLGCNIISRRRSNKSIFSAISLKNRPRWMGDLCNPSRRKSSADTSLLLARLGVFGTWSCCYPLLWKLAQSSQLFSTTFAVFG